MVENPSVYGIVLNWNNYPDTSETIQSLNKVNYEKFNLILVDNGSTDQSGELLESEFPEVDVVYTGENLGFAGGMNVGIQKAMKQGADYLWLLNNDLIILDEDVLQSCVEYMIDYPGIGIMTPVVVHYPDTENIWFQKGEFRKRTGEVKNKQASGPDKDTNLIHNEYIPNSCSLIRSDVIDEVGDLDERFFLYYEDVEYSLRVRKKGYSLVTNNDVSVAHKVNSTAGSGLEPLPTYYSTRSRYLLSANIVNDRYSTILYIWWILKAITDRILHKEWHSIVSVFKGLFHGLCSYYGERKF